MDTPETENKNGQPLPEAEKPKKSKRARKRAYLVKYPYEVAGIRYGGMVELSQKDAERLLAKNIIIPKED